MISLSTSATTLPAKQAILYAGVSAIMNTMGKIQKILGQPISESMSTIHQISLVLTRSVVVGHGLMQLLPHMKAFISRCMSSSQGNASDSLVDFPQVDARFQRQSILNVPDLLYILLKSYLAGVEFITVFSCSYGLSLSENSLNRSLMSISKIMALHYALSFIISKTVGRESCDELMSENDFEIMRAGTAALLLFAMGMLIIVEFDPVGLFKHLDLIFILSMMQAVSISVKIIYMVCALPLVVLFIAYTPDQFKRALDQGHRFPAGIVLVTGDLDLSNRLDLTSLPNHLRIRGDLNLSHCINLTSLPDDLQLMGDLNLRGCHRLTSLPNWITTLGYNLDSETTRHVFIENTGLSEQTLERLRHTPTPGMQFHFSMAPVASLSSRAQPVMFQSLEEAFAFWESQTKGSAKYDLSNLEMDLSNIEPVLMFLSELKETAEYKNPHTRAHLATRVLDAFLLMSTDSSIKEKALWLIQEGLTSCHDRVISAVEQIELMVRLHNIEQSGVVDEATLRELGKSFLMLKRVHEEAKNHVQTLQYVDEVEVYLAFQIELADRLKLPLSTRNMLYRRCASATPKQIQDAGDRIEKAYTEEQLSVFLETWDPWIKHQKKLETQNLKYDSLPEDDKVVLEKEATCPINRDTPQQPVVCNGVIYDFNALIKWYQQNGTDPSTRVPIVLSELRRPKIQG
jgi:hypothetical protein